MKILVIPDIHQTMHWQKLFESPVIDTVDEIVQLGDWFDSFKPDWKCNAPIMNLRKAFELKETYKNFHILIGNHDFQYLTGGGCSGFQYSHCGVIYGVIIENRNMFDIAFESDGWVFSHAGFSKTWMSEHGFTNVGEVNKKFHDIVDYKKFDFDFMKEEGVYPVNCMTYPDGDIEKYNRGVELFKSITGEEFTLDKFKDMIMTSDTFAFDGIDRYGNDKTQGPLWIRPNALSTDMYFKKQCVGHTESHSAPIYISDDASGEKLIVTDNVNHDMFFVLDTENDELCKIQI